MAKEIRVLTLREPWASLILEGIKKIETRSWKTNYRGDLYIHAGKSMDSYDKSLELDVNRLDYHPGHIIGKCKLVDCIYMDEDFILQIQSDDYKNYISGDYCVGRYAWILEDVERIDPIEIKGKLGLWKAAI